MTKNKKTSIITTASIIFLSATILCITLISIQNNNLKSDPKNPEQTTTQNTTPQILKKLFTINSIPKIYITSESKAPDRKTYSPATVQIIDDTFTENNTGVLSGAMRARGNSTFKIATELNGPMPYKIKLTEKHSLLGMRKHKKWNLLANFYDRSYVKQFIAFGAASIIYGQNHYQPQAKYVEVYFNNEYKGLYLLTESIEEDDGALDIEVDLAKANDNIPFLLEMENVRTINHKYPGNKTTLKSSFSEDMFYANADVDAPFWLLDNDPTNDELMTPQPYILKYPSSFQDISSSQAANIKKSMRNLYSDAAKQTPLESLNIDVDSFINSWIFCELFTNMSCYHGASSYIYRTPSSPKIISGPLWDFDRSLTYGVAGFYSRGENVLMQNLIKNPEFNQRLVSRFTKVYTDILPHMKDQIVSLKSNQILKTAVLKAEEKYDTWHLSFADYSDHYSSDYPDKYTLQIDSYEEHIDYILEKLLIDSDNKTSRAHWIYQNLDNWGK